MLVECITEDFSDPEAVSGSSTTIRIRIAHLGVFCCRCSVNNRARHQENSHLNGSVCELERGALKRRTHQSGSGGSHLRIGEGRGNKKEAVDASFLISEGSTTASKVEPSVLWSVELYFGSNVCFWLLYKICMQKLLL